MKNVLIVDDDSATRALLSRVLKVHADEFDILTAKNGREASDIISSNKINLIITDIQMPELDGFGLITHVANNYPEIPVLVMTAHATSDVKAKLKTHHSPKLFEKPLNMDILTEAISEELDAGAEGKIRGISLASFLQLIEMEKKTCTLKISCKGQSGNMYFQKGEMFDAKMGDLKKEEAAYELICWDKIEIDIKDVCKKQQKVINQPLMNLLMEALKIKDEKEAKENVRRAPLKPLKNLTLKKA